MKRTYGSLNTFFDVGDTLWLQSVVASAVCNSVWLARLGMLHWAEQYFDTGMSESRCFISSDQQWSQVQLAASYTWFLLSESFSTFWVFGCSVVFYSLALCFMFAFLFSCFCLCVCFAKLTPSPSYCIHPVRHFSKGWSKQSQSASASLKEQRPILLKHSEGWLFFFW